MVILGIDPGLAIVGWGVIEYQNTRFRTIAYGAITTEAGIDVEVRLKHVYDELCEIIDYYHPDQMAVEELLSKSHARTIRVCSPAGSSGSGKAISPDV